MKSFEEIRTIYLIIVPILGFLHVLVPAWGIIIPDIGASFYWYWGFYVVGVSGEIMTGTITNDAIFTAGMNATYLMFIGFTILLITIILASIVKTLETKKYLTLFSIIWIIIGILLIIAPSIYLNSVIDRIFDEYSVTIGIFISYILAIVPLLLGIALLYVKSKIT